MKTKRVRWNELSVLDAAIVAGLFAVFLAVATPLIRGALLRQRTAECARKIIRAVEAFDFYETAMGTDLRGADSGGDVLQGALVMMEIDWWDRKTDVGGRWDWYSNGRTSSVVIAGVGIPEQQMLALDELIDDGNLETGTFQRRASRYHYIIKRTVL